MRARITRNVAAAVALAFTFGAIVAFGSFASPDARGRTLDTVGSACRTGTGMSAGPGMVAGTLPLGGSSPRDRVLVQILPRVPYGSAYVEALRRRDGLPVRSHAALAPRELQGLRDALRYAPVERSGRFACGGLPAGAYFAVATMSGESASVAAYVASFDVLPGAQSLTLVKSDGFRPLAAASP